MQILNIRKDEPSFSLPPSSSQSSYLKSLITKISHLFDRLLSPYYRYLFKQETYSVLKAHIKTTKPDDNIVVCLYRNGAEFLVVKPDENQTPKDFLTEVKDYVKKEFDKEKFSSRNTLTLGTVKVSLDKQIYINLDHLIYNGWMNGIKNVDSVVLPWSKNVTGPLEDRFRLVAPNAPNLFPSVIEHIAPLL